MLSTSRIKDARTLNNMTFFPMADFQAPINGRFSAPNDMQFGAEALALLRDEFNIPTKWQQVIGDVGEVQFDRPSLTALLDGWFGSGNQQVRTAIDLAAGLRIQSLHA